MSRISRLRSMTLTLSRLSRLFCCAGLSSSSATRTSNPVSDLRLGQLLGLALAHVPVGVDVAAVLPLRAHDVGARRGRQRGELGQAVVGGPALVVAGVDGDEEGLLDGRREVDGLAGAHGGTAYRRAVIARQPVDEARRGDRRRSASGSPAASRTSSEGSRRNQVRWRRANWALRWASSSIAASSVELAVEHRPALAVADGRERGQAGVVPLAQGARLLDEAGVELGAGPDRDAAAVLGGLEAELEAEHGRRVAEGAGQRRVAAERRDLEGAHDAPRVAQVGARGERRRRRGQARRRGRRGRRAPGRARAPRGRPRPTGARPCRCPR